jgi:hypothetical protein
MAKKELKSWSKVMQVDYGSGGTDHGLAGGGQVGVDAGSNGVEVGGRAGEHFDAGSGIPGRGSVLVVESVSRPPQPLLPPLPPTALFC